jgi:L-amino acid N-acyltransferase YncA
MNGRYQSILRDKGHRGISSPGSTWAASKGGIAIQYRFERLSEEHRKPAIDILNYYIENGFATFSETKVNYDFFDHYLRESKGYPAVAVRSDSGEIIGTAYLGAYNPSKAFQRTAEIGYYIRRDWTRHGIGKAILDHFVEEARKIGIDSILASVSSLNDQSINFHLKNGFIECGRFRRIGRKFGRDFDLVWLQKHI